MATELVFERRAELTRHSHEGKAGLAGGIPSRKFKCRLRGETFGVCRPCFAQGVGSLDAGDLAAAVERERCAAREQKEADSSNKSSFHAVPSFRGVKVALTS